MNTAVGIFEGFCGYLGCIFLGVLAVIVLWKLASSDGLELLISEANGAASMSRFQLLVFTFVVAMGLTGMIQKTHEFPKIPDGVLTLLGISASAFAVGKSIPSEKSDKEGLGPAAVTKLTPPPAPPARNP
jgi:hypothetical protein